MENTQSERRMLSSVLNRIPWNTDVMRTLEQLDPNQTNGVCFTPFIFPLSEFQRVHRKLSPTFFFMKNSFFLTVA